VQPEAYRKLLERLSEIADLHRTAALLLWDRLTCMPPGGAAARGEQLATVRRLAHSRLTSPEFGELLEALREYESSLPPDGDEASMVRVARRHHDKATRIPAELVAERARAAAAGHEAWLKAREANRFEVFRPALERTVRLSREIASALGYTLSPLDPLIDLAEPGVDTAFCRSLFDELRKALVPLARAIAAKSPGDEDAILRQPFDPDLQLAMGKEAVAAIGFDFQRRGRVDLSVHPFTTSFSPDDTRITTRIDPHDFTNCFYSLLHEAGHGLYEQGLPRQFDRTVLCASASAGVHESQSRLWENFVGRSLAFWRFFLPRAARYFPEQLGAWTPEDLYRAVNRVTPSFIRTEADEVTYNLHVMLRFDLEQEVLEDRLAVADLKEAWNHKMQEYLGVVPPDDLRGILQDIHWSGSFGGDFQGYTLGNVMAAQLYEAAGAECPDLGAAFTRGHFQDLGEWMRQRVHAQGARFEPLELIRRATGRPLDAAAYLRYLREKFGQLYGV